MANIERIVNVQISLNTTGISREGFSTGLIVGEHTHTLERVTTYRSIDEMTSAGFSGNDPLYLAAQDYFSQTPKPREVKIGRRLCGNEINVAQILPAGTYTITVLTRAADSSTVATPYTFVNNGSTDATAILTELANTISADANADITATIDETTLKISARTGETYALQVTDNLNMAQGSSTETIAATMNAILEEDDDFYGIMLTSRKQEDILAMAAWAEAHTKLFGTAIAEDAAKIKGDYSDTGSLLMMNNYYRTFWFYHATADSDYPECALMARCFSILPGGETWANKKLSGVIADDLSETSAQAIFGKNGNTFEKFRNVTISQNGKVAAGEWIDVIRFRDWLQEEAQTRIFDALVNNNKIPYTDAGIAIIEAHLRAALELGQKRGGIAPTEYDSSGNKNLGFVIEVPLASDISAGQKASRILEDVEFTARLAGAIHVVEIRGSLTYENLFAETEG